MKKNNITKIMTVLIASTYIICQNISVGAIAFPIIITSVIGNDTTAEQVQKINENDVVEELTTDERIDKADELTAKNLAEVEEYELRIDNLLYAENGGVPYTERVTVHTENCLGEDCGVSMCITNVSSGYDLDFNDITVQYYTEEGEPVYGYYAVRNLGMDRNTFIETVAPFAQSAQKEFGIPASTILAQAILESSWGRKVIGNNIFGIKDTKSYYGPTVVTGTFEYNINGTGYSTSDVFRGYNSIGEAVYDYSKNVIHGNPELYSGVITDNWIDSVYGLTTYATDPEYFELLISVIQDFNLTRFNNEDYKTYIF